MIFEDEFQSRFALLYPSGGPGSLAAIRCSFASARPRPALEGASKIFAPAVSLDTGSVWKGSD